MLQYFTSSGFTFVDGYDQIDISGIAVLGFGRLSRLRTERLTMFVRHGDTSAIGRAHRKRFPCT